MSPVLICDDCRNADGAGRRPAITSDLKVYCGACAADNGLSPGECPEPPYDEWLPRARDHQAQAEHWASGLP